MPKPKPINRRFCLVLTMALAGSVWAQSPGQPQTPEPDNSEPSSAPTATPEKEPDASPPPPRAFKPSEEVHADTILTLPADF